MSEDSRLESARQASKSVESLLERWVDGQEPDWEAVQYLTNSDMISFARHVAEARVREALEGLNLRGISYHADLAEEGNGWESACEPRPQYFTTLPEAIDHQVSLGVREALLEVNAIAKETAVEVGGEFHKTHMLNVGLHKFIYRLRERFPELQPAPPRRDDNK